MVEVGGRRIWLRQRRQRREVVERNEGDLLLWRTASMYIRQRSILRLLRRGLHGGRVSGEEEEEKGGNRGMQVK